jgi:hypothetical protein
MHWRTHPPINTTPTPAHDDHQPSTTTHNAWCCAQCTAPPPPRARAGNELHSTPADRWPTRPGSKSLTISLPASLPPRLPAPRLPASLPPCLPASRPASPPPCLPACLPASLPARPPGMNIAFETAQSSRGGCRHARARSSGPLFPGSGLPRTHSLTRGLLPPDALTPSLPRSSLPHSTHPSR